MNYKETLEFLYSLQKSGIKFGLENTIKLLDFLGNPHTKFKSIHIAGTNGKGSTSTFIASILHELNFKVGLYTSPHLVKFNERIKINGDEIDDDYIVNQVNNLKPMIDELKPTFFEVTTAIAFQYFAEMNVDYAVIETGMGGRLDSTNVIQPEISVITKIDFDHREFLGDTLEKITFEKAGIIKENTPVVVSKNSKEVYDILKKVALKRNAKVYLSDELYVESDVNQNLVYLNASIKSRLTQREYKIQSSLTGKFQIENLKLAIAAIEILFPEMDLTNQLKKALKEPRFKLLGRFQVIEGTPEIILDTCHNSNAIENFLESLNSIAVVDKIAIFGIMQDKEIDSIIPLIEKSFNRIILTQAKTERSLDITSLAEKFDKSKITLASDVETSIRHVLVNLKPDLLVIFGSNYIVGEAISALKNLDILK